MVFTNHAKQLAGFTQHTPPQQISCRLIAIKIYSIHGLAFPEADEVRIGGLRPGVEYGIGNSLNKICREIIGEDITADEDNWLQEHSARKPFLVTVTAEENLATKACEWIRQEGDILQTYDAFTSEKNELDELTSQWEVPAVLRVGAALSTEDRLVKIVHVKTQKMGRLDDGRWLADIHFSGHASLTRNHGLPIDIASQLINDSARDVADVGERVSRLMYAAIQERDNMKAFLFSWMALEVLVNKRFDALSVKLFPDHGLPEEMGLRVAKLYQDKNRTREVRTASQKFAYLVIFQWRALEPTDFDAFVSVKKYRDEFAHGNAIDHRTLPTESILMLLNKILNQ
ncbi:hypothetical protein [Rugamonas aquatica]|uniref:Apea-like HEPN domain-containing protein n=1 Tax=Rugamonas aquatica TaxID=2743357 RepID=A0A6A7N991_9BURK|nr:hypothetical protein [Rugamonas aquatica]MQA41591.1 hypothetical protein [Rugamonas aquatica]